MAVQPLPDSPGRIADPVSPELVLVDAELARVARARLAAPSAVPSAPRARAPQATQVSSAPRREARTDRASRRVLVGVAVATVLVLVLFDVRVEVGEIPASAEPEALESPVSAPSASPKPVKPSPVTPTRGGKSGRAARRFAWAPVEGATGYHVEFFRGPTRVYAQATVGPSLEVPAHWRYEGARRSFRPGATYGWYVWPMIGGRRAPRAAVQTTVSIPAG